MKNIFLALVAVLIAHSATAQEKYPQGLYMSFGEIVSKSPSVQTDSVKVERRNVGVNGGNDYKLISQSKTIKKTFKNKVWAYSDGDTLYVNGRNFNVQQGYACAVADGQKYLSIYAATSSSAVSTATVTSAVAFGLMGAAFMGSAMADVRYYYAIDKTTGKLHLVTIKFLKEVLPDRNKEAYADFQKDLEIMDNVYNPNQKKSVKNVIIGKYARLLD